MRSIRLLAATTVILAAAWSCGGGGTDQNTNPVAAFDQQCTGLACTFADHSTPAGGLTWAWDFGDVNSGANNTATIQNPSHTFTAAGTYNVKLTVTDASGGSNAKTNAVIVAGAANQPPVATFDLPASCTAGTPCGFHTTSTDADGTIASSHWAFSDGGTADSPDATHLDATHTFATAGPYTVTLTVTDNGGATSAPVAKPLTVTAQAAQGCTTQGKIVDCNLQITGTKAVTLKFVMVSHDCQFSGNKLTANTPALGATFQTVFFNLCNRLPNEEKVLADATGNPLVLQPGTPFTVRFSAGSPGPTDPPAGDAGVRVTGNQQVNWTLNMDDGGLAGQQGEPDFNDAVVSVIATPQ
jgi:PKD repeat protein